MTIKKMAEMTGLSVEAIRAYIKKGQIRIQVHWIKARNGRTMIHVERFNDMAGRYRGVDTPWFWFGRSHSHWRAASTNECSFRFLQLARERNKRPTSAPVVLMEIALGTFPTLPSDFPRADGLDGYRGIRGSLVTVAEALRDYLREIGQRCAPSTVRDYSHRTHKHLLPTFGHLALAELTPEAVRQWLQSIDLSSKAKNNILIPLRRIFDRAFEDGVIDKNPMLRVKGLPVQAREADPFSIDEVRLILGELRLRSEQAAGYFGIAFQTGLRTSELLALECGRRGFGLQETLHHQGPCSWCRRITKNKQRTSHR
ncbi:MAG: hypothetical protein ACN6I7_04070 [bacterium]